jgi:hypothetical protein
VSGSAFEIACRMLVIKIALYWLAELVICRIDHSRLICSVIAKGFWPCLATFACMDFLVLPQLRRQLQRWRTRRHQRGL